MLAVPTLRSNGLALATAGIFAASPALAQEWSVYAGAAGRVNYNDNYFFVVPGQPVPGIPNATEQKESAITLSLLPFVSASRRTEISEVTALLAIGVNKVWRISPNEDYLSSRLALDGTLREERTTWTGRASYSRSSSLDQAVAIQDVLLVRTYTDAVTMEGAYSYQLTDRWAVGTTVGGYANWYDSVQGGVSQSDDRGYNVIGNLGYIHSDQTRFTYTFGYTYYFSDVTRSNALTTTLGVVHRFSPQLTISASVGGFWSETTARQNIPGQGTPIEVGESRDDSGTMFGGSVNYDIWENTRFDLSMSQALAPSGAGALSKSDDGSVTLSHRFSERLTGLLGASYSRHTPLAALDGSASTSTLVGQAGLSYRIAERWTLDAGYQYTRGRYSQSSGEPRSNAVFLTIGYNWPGASFTGWVGGPAQTQGLPAAGPLSLPETQRGTSQVPFPQSFDGLTLP